MAFYSSKENFSDITRGSSLAGSAVISTVNSGVTGQNDDEVDHGIQGALTGITPPSIVSFYAIPTSVSWGEPASLFWTTTNTDTISLNYGIGDVSSFGVASGRYDIARVEQNSTFELSAENSAATVKSYAIISLRGQTPRINHFYADPTSISYGAGVTLNWSISEEPTSVSVAGIGSVAAYGLSLGSYHITAVTQSTIYNLTASNYFGSASSTANLTVQAYQPPLAPVIFSFYADPNNTLGTGRTTLRWGIANSPTSISISPNVGTISAADNHIFVDGLTDNTTYTITASNEGGTTTRSTQVVFDTPDIGNAGASCSVDFAGTNALVSFDEMKDLAQNKMLVWFNMDGAVSTVNSGARAVSFYGDDPSFTWFRFVNGNYKGLSGEFIYDDAGVTIDEYETLKNTSVKEWYTWGARRFSINLPFGKVPSGGGRKEALIYQPDSYVNARDGLNINGVTCNEPMPWLVGDFVKTWKALTSGTQGTLTNPEWTTLTSWFDPTQPISVMFYNGTINHENYVRWKGYGYTGAKDRLIDSFTPYLQAGGQLGLDALTRSPGQTIGFNVSQSVHENTPSLSQFLTANNEHADGTTYGSTLDSAWWSFYDTWLLPNFGQDNLYCEGAPEAFKINGTWYDNPYLGNPFISDDQGLHQNYGNEASSTSPTRQHKLSEMGHVEGIIGNFQGIRKYPIAGISSSAGFTFGRYWYLRDYAAPAHQSDVPEMDGTARVYRAVESTGYGNMLWEYAWVADKLLNKNQITNDDTSLDDTIGAAYFHQGNFLNVGVITGEGDAYTNVGGVEDFRSRFPTVDSYAQYLCFLKSGGTPIPRGFSTGYTHPSTIVNPADIIDLTRLLSFGLKGHGIVNALWIYMDEIDDYCRTKLNGVSGGALYRPSITADIEQQRFKDYLEYRRERTKQLSGYYPQHLIFSLTKNDGTTNPSQFQMERYLYTPASTPTSSDYAQYSSSSRPCYDGAEPTVLDFTPPEGEPPVLEDELISSGYSTTHADYLLSVDLISKLLDLTNEWKTENGHSISIGVDNLPDTSVSPRTSYTITGGGTGVTLEFTNLWSAVTWSNPLATGGSVVLDEYNTTLSKERLRLEYLKRVEPLLTKVNVLYPEVYDRYTLDVFGQDEKYESYHREKLQMADAAKSAPFNFNGDIYSLISYAHYGSAEGPTFNHLDPKTINSGATIAHSDIYEDMVNWVSDEFFSSTPQKVVGQSFWNNIDYASAAIGVSSYAGITADRVRVHKWLMAFGGTGATVDWGNSMDVLDKMGDFYTGHSDLIKKYSYTFGGEELEQPQPTTPRMKVLTHTCYHPTTGSVNNVYDSGTSYDNLDVQVSKIFYQNRLVSGICAGTGRYRFETPYTYLPGMMEPFVIIPGNTLTGEFVNTLADSLSVTDAEYENAATTLLEYRLMFLNATRTNSGEIHHRPDDNPPLGDERLTYTGYIIPDIELINYPAFDFFQNDSEAARVAAMKLNTRMIYNAIKRVYPMAKVGHWGLGGAMSEPFNTYSIRWDDFIADPTVAGNSFVDAAGVSLAVTGVTGWVNYVAAKMEHIFADSCDFFMPNFYTPYRGTTSQNPATTDIHYDHISSFWASAAGDKAANSRTKSYADVAMRVFNKANELLVASGKTRKEIIPSTWHYNNSSQQFGLASPVASPIQLSVVYGCGITFGITADRSDSYYSLRKFMEQNLGVSGSTYNFFNIEKFGIAATCDSIDQLVRRHPTHVDVDRDFIYNTYIKTALERGADAIHNWTMTPSYYDRSYAVRPNGDTDTFFNLGDNYTASNEHAVETIYSRRYAMESVLGLCMAGITFKGYNNEPNTFPGAVAAGLSFASWGDSGIKPFLSHKYTDHVLRNFVQYYADLGISDGLIT